MEGQGKARQDKTGWDGTGQGLVQLGETSQGVAEQEGWCKSIITGAKGTLKR